MKIAEMLKLTDENWVRKPAGFRVRFHKREEGRWVRDYMPGLDDAPLDSDVVAWRSAWKMLQGSRPGEGELVNLTVVNLEGGPIRLYFPDPFMRPSSASQSSDPIINALKAALPSGYELHFVDDWYSYHTMMGEVHCGTNVTRTPTAQWWTDGQHLLGGGS